MLSEKDSYWFPMRVRHSSISRLTDIKSHFDGLKDFDGTAYVPMGYMQMNREKMGFAPILLNYIFVRSTYKDLLRVKSNQEYFEPLRFVMHPAYDEKFNVRDEILTVPNKTMDDFIRLTKEENEKVILLENMEYACRPSQAVQITQGKFTGVVGRVKRVGGNRCIVLPVIKGKLVIGVMDVPYSHLRYLTDEEFEDIQDAKEYPGQADS